MLQRLAGSAAVVGGFAAVTVTANRTPFAPLGHATFDKSRFSLTTFAVKSFGLHDEKYEEL